MCGFVFHDANIAPHLFYFKRKFMLTKMFGRKLDNGRRKGDQAMKYDTVVQITNYAIDFGHQVPPCVWRKWTAQELWSARKFDTDPQRHLCQGAP